MVNVLNSAIAYLCLIVFSSVVGCGLWVARGCVVLGAWYEVQGTIFIK